MRYGRRVPKLNMPPDQRKTLLRGFTMQLFKHEDQEHYWNIPRLQYLKERSIMERF